MAARPSSKAVAYRLQGHYFGDPMDYVPTDELEAARAKAPFDTYRAQLADEGVATAEELDAVDAVLADEVEEAFRFAVESPETDVAELEVDVFGGVSTDPSRSHGAPAVAIPDGETETMGLVQAVNRTLDRALARDDRVLLLGEDIADPAGGLFKVTYGLSTKHGTDRVRNTPIAESSIIGAAIGASMAGMRPVAELMFMDFLGVAMDQIANHAAKIRYMSGGRQHAPLVIRTVVGYEQRAAALAGARGVGDARARHQGGVAQHVGRRRRVAERLPRRRRPVPLRGVDEAVLRWRAVPGTPGRLLAPAWARPTASARATT